MANVLVEETSLSNIASAIRVKNGSTAVYKPGEMAAAISNLPTGGSGGGSSDNEDSLIMDTLTNYENTRVTKIREGCFYYSRNLVTASFPNATEIGQDAFLNAFNLSDVYLPNVKTMNGGNTFHGCYSLASINLPQLEVLKGWTFYECHNLEKVDLGNCHQFYMYDQFKNCKKLTILILRKNTVCQLFYSPVTNPDNDYSAFKGTPIVDQSLGEGYVYVPKTLVNEYKNATNWTVIADRIRAIEDYPEITGG